MCAQQPIHQFEIYRLHIHSLVHCVAVVVVVDNFVLRLWGETTTLIPPPGLGTPADSFLGTILFFTDITTVLEPERDRWAFFFFFSFHTHKKKEWGRGNLHTTKDRSAIHIKLNCWQTAAKKRKKKGHGQFVEYSRSSEYLLLFFYFFEKKKKISCCVFFFFFFNCLGRES